MRVGLCVCYCAVRSRILQVGALELLAVIAALKQWRCYLEGATGGVTVVTDHKPNTFLDSKPAVQLSSRQVHWQQFLSRFDFEWEYRKGCHNVADTISRNPALYAMQAQLHAMQAKDSGDAANLSDEDMEVYDSLNSSTQFLQCVRNGYAKGP